MKQVWVKRAACSWMASTTDGALLPTLVVEMPEPKSISRLPSTSSRMPGPARTTKMGRVVLTPFGMARCRRASSSRERGPGISVRSRRCCGTSPGLACTIAPPGSDVQRRHDVLDPGVVLEPVHGEILAVARVTVAAMGHLSHQRNVRVDPDAPEVEPLGHAHRATVVARPDRRGQPELDLIGPGHRLLLIGEALHRDDRAEHLLLDDLVGLLDPGDHGGLIEEPPDRKSVV